MAYIFFSLVEHGHTNLFLILISFVMCLRIIYLSFFLCFWCCLYYLNFKKEYSEVPFKYGLGATDLSPLILWWAGLGSNIKLWGGVQIQIKILSNFLFLSLTRCPIAHAWGSLVQSLGDASQFLKTWLTTPRSVAIYVRTISTLGSSMLYAM